ncbi:hypothetical protein M9458_049443, partial [Cirrhinus mrigala]
VGFEDIIAEPISTHSFDRVWIGSHAVFELVKYIFYRILTTFLAIPMAFIVGIVFGILSCIHIWYEKASCWGRLLAHCCIFHSPIAEYLPWPLPT